MWAALPPLQPWPWQLSIPKQPPRRSPMVIHSRQGKAEEVMSGLGQAAAMKSNKPKQGNEERQLSGADVLMALQRAASWKKKQQKMETSNSSSAVSAGGRHMNKKKKNKNEGKIPNYSNVRPLCIKPEWSHQLDELETRLQQHTHTT